MNPFTHRDPVKPEEPKESPAFVFLSTMILLALAVFAGTTLYAIFNMGLIISNQ
jgi:hypothetical protein